MKSRCGLLCCVLVISCACHTKPAKNITLLPETLPTSESSQEEVLPPVSTEESDDPYRTADGGKSNLKWTAFKGPDFWVDYAELEGETGTRGGVYTGFAPSFRPTAKTVIKGKLGDYDVGWEPKTSNEYPYGRESLIRFKGGTFWHVWLFADSQEKLERMTKEFGRLRAFSKKH